MPLLVRLDPLGEVRWDFYQTRDRLLHEKKKFDRETLHHIPYEQLVLCAIGEAGTAACSLRLVQEEKLARRERFLSMSPSEIQACERFLRLEQMHDDVELNVKKLSAPSWDDLTNCQKAWAKLLCIFNHIDQPHQRLGEGILIIRKAVRSGEIPAETGEGMIERLRSLLSSYPSDINAEQLRDKVFDILDGLMAFFEGNEAAIASGELIKDFSCTSDCFRVTNWRRE